MNSEKAFDDLINEAKQAVWMVATLINNHDANLLLNALKKGAEVKVLATNQADLSILKKLVKKGAKVKVYADNLPYKLCIADGKVKVLKEDVLHEVDVAEAVKIFRKLWVSSKSTIFKLASKDKQLEKIYFKLTKSIVNGKEEIRFMIPKRKFEIKIVNPRNPPILMKITHGSKTLTTRSAYIEALTSGAVSGIWIYNIEKNEWGSESLHYPLHDRVFNRIRALLSPYVGDEEVIESLAKHQEFFKRFLDTVTVYLGTEPASKVIGDKLAEDLKSKIYKMAIEQGLITQNHSLKIENIYSGTPAYSHINIINRECRIYSSISITFSIEPPLLTKKDDQLYSNYSNIVTQILEKTVKDLQLETYKKEYESHINNTIGEVKRFLKRHGLEKLTISVELSIYVNLGKYVGQNIQVRFPRELSNEITLFTLEYKII
jgi:hypothetical protein